MKQMPWHETVRIYPFAVCLSLIIFPVIVLAQTFDTTPPYIAHQAIKLSRINSPVSLVALISDQGGVRETMVRVQYQDEDLELTMVPEGADKIVPVRVRCIVSRAIVYQGPGDHYKKVGEIMSGQTADVTLIREKYFRIRAESGLTGYIDNSSCEAMGVGQAYRVTIPTKATQATSLKYQIFAMDNFGNESQTEIYDVKLISEQELLNLQKQAGIGQKEAGGSGAKMSKKSGPFYTRPWFWITAVAIGGGAYYLVSGGEEDKKDNKATVDVIIAW